MALVIDANIIISALIADSKTRELIVTLEPELLTPEVVTDELTKYEALIAEKSGMSTRRVDKLLDILFQYIEVVGAEEFYPYVDSADEALGDVDEDDVLYLAVALARDAAIWSDDKHFDEQDLVRNYRTSEVIASFETR